MPGKWVFPGGRIARSDFAAPRASDLRREVADALAERIGARRARALAVTAIRETFEETGLLLAAPADAARRRGAWQAFCATGLAPDLGCLGYIGRLITPPHRPKRFDTRFFIADAARLASRDPVDSRELEEVSWVAMDEALTLDLALPTRLVLDDLRQRLAGQEDRPRFFRRFRTARG